MNRIINFVLLFFIIFSSITNAQPTGRIKGKVIDKTTKQPVFGAGIQLLNTKLGTVTDENGIYIIENIPENIYKIKVSFLSYNPLIEPDIRIIRGKTTDVHEIELIPSPIITNDVIVSSGFFDDQKDIPVSHYDYTREEIVRAPGAMGDIFRAVETLPGVSTSGGEFSSFSVRGDTPRDNIILIDNIPFNQVAHFSETGGNLEIQGGRMSIFSQGLIDKASFQSGGFSSKFGGKRASLLDLTLREGNKQSSTLSIAGDLTGGEFVYDGPALLIPETGILFSARIVDFSTVLKLIEDEGDGSSGFSDFILKTSSNINENNKISLLGLFSTEKHKRSQDHYFKGNDFLELELSEQTEDKTLFGINWRLLTGKSGFLSSSVYYCGLSQYQASGTIETDPIYDRKPSKDEITIKYPIYEYNLDEKQLGFKTDFTYNLSNQTILSAGFSAQKNISNTKIDLNQPDTLFIYNAGEPIDGKNYVVVSPLECNSSINKSRLEYAGYINTSYSPTDRICINTGLRYEFDNISNANLFSPRFSGSYKLDKITSINFSAGIYYQLPVLRQISYNYNNLSLKNEKSTQFIVGIDRYLADDIKLTIEGYYKILNDLVVEHNSNNNIANNSGKGYSYGTDISIIKKFVDNYYGQINYSYSKTGIKEKAGDSYFPSDFNQPHMFNILFGYQLNDNWFFSVKWKYATGRPADSYIINKNVFNNQNRMRFSKEIISRNTTRLSDFHSLNFRIDYRVQLSEHFAINAFLDIMNLYNRENQVYEIFEPTVGKTKFSSLSMLPTIGIKIEL